MVVMACGLLDNEWLEFKQVQFASCNRLVANKVINITKNNRLAIDR